MMKLLKYELLRRKQLLIGAAISIAFVEGLALLGIYNSGGMEMFKANGFNGWHMLAIIMTVLLAVGVFVLAFLDAIVKLYSDFKQKHGLMLFMTPQSGYRVIWAKTIFAVAEILIAGLAVAGCLALSAAALDQCYDGVVGKLLASFGMYRGLALGSIALGALQLIAQLSIAMLAVTVSRVLTRSSSWIIALLMYFALVMVVNMANGVLLVAFGVIGDVMSATNDTTLLQNGIMSKYFIIGALTYIAWFFGCTTVSGRLINRGIDL